MKESTVVTSATTDAELTSVSTKKKGCSKDKPHEKSTVVATETPNSKSKNFSHDATVLHVSQDSTNCTPLTVLKPIASSTPDLCYAGTEDIVPKDGTKPAKNKRKTCSKKENKSGMKHKPENNNIDLPVKKKRKTLIKKLAIKSENVNGSIDGKVESKDCSVEPVKKKKRTRKVKAEIKGCDGSTTVKSEINGVQKKKVKKNKKLTENVKEEQLETSAHKDTDQTVKTGGTKKKRKVDIENDASDECSKAKKKKKSDKKNSIQGKGSATKKKKEVKIQSLNNSSDLNTSVDNQDEDSHDLSAVLMNKKPTAEALALQATVEKLQGRLTPTLYQGNNSSSTNGSTNGKNIETLRAILPKLVCSRSDNHKQEDEIKVQNESGMHSKTTVAYSIVGEEVENKGSSQCNDNKEPSTASLSNIPLNLSNSKETTKPTAVSTNKSAVSTNRPVTHRGSDSSTQSVVLDLSSKAGKSIPVISKDGSINLSLKDQSVLDEDKSVHQTPTKMDLLVKQIAHVNNLDKFSKKACESESAANELNESQNKHDKGAPKDDEKVNKPQRHSKAVKKERVESAIERLFQKRDITTGSSGVKKQRVEKTIDMLLAKKEKTVEQSERDTGVAENLHQKSIKDSDNTKDNRS